jgi:MFS family permease
MTEPVVPKPAATEVRTRGHGEQPPVQGASGGPMSRQYRVISVSLLALVTIVAFEAMAISTAMPVVARDLGAVRSYGLAFSLLLTAQLLATVVAGVWCDRAGPMPSLYVGQVLFGAGCLVAGAAISFPILLVGRVLAGLGAGLVIVALNVVIGRAFPMSVRPKVFSWMSAAWVLPSLVGPPLAGWLATYSWRLVFFLVVPPVLVVFLLIGSQRDRLGHTPGVGLPTDDRSTAAGHRRTAAFGVVVATSAVLLQYASQHLTPVSPATTALAIAGLVGIALVLPKLVPPGTLAMARGLPSVMFSRFVLAGSWAGGTTFVPLMLVATRHLSPALAGAMLTVGSLGWSAGSWAQGRDRFHGRRSGLIAVGAVCLSTGTAALAAMTQFGWPSGVVALAEIAAGLGMGLSMSSTSVLALGLSPTSEHGRASSSLQLCDTLGSLLGIAAAGAVFAALHHPGDSDAHVFVLIWSGLALLAGVGVVSGQRTRT